MLNPGLGSWSNGYKALIDEGIKTMECFLPMETNMFSKVDLDKGGFHGLITGEV